MRPSLLVAAGACLLALAAFAGGGLQRTASNFTSAATNTGNTFAATAANAAPSVSAAVIGKSSGGAVGYLKRSASFYVYANASDDNAVSSVKATVTNVTGSSTAVALTAGSYTAGGIGYGYRSALLTSTSSLTAGAKSFTVTATDASALTDTFTGSVTIDLTAPSASSIVTTNKAGNIAGRADPGDSATITYSEAIDPGSILSGWDGTATDVQAAIIDGGGGQNDLLRVYDQSALDPNTYLPAGTIDLGRSDFVTSGSYAVFGLAIANGTSSTMVLSGKVLTITLGSLDYGTSNTTAGTTIERYTPVATITDLAGNPSGTTTVSATGSHKGF